MRFLTPTGNKRLNELIGFLCIVLGLLVSAALFTYSPTDNSFNVAAHAPDGNPSHNFIGPIGAYGSDLLFQGLGYAAFLLPIALITVGWKWFRSRAVESQVATLIGYGLLVISIPTLLTLIPFPDVRGAIPAAHMRAKVTRVDGFSPPFRLSPRRERKTVLRSSPPMPTDMDESAAS